MAAEDKFIKKPGAKIVYTKEQMDDLRGCMHPVDGPMYFMENFMMIQHATKGSMLFDPYQYQRNLVKTCHTNRFTCCLLSRQMGKCLLANANIRVRNKITGEVLDITIGEFHEMVRKKD